MTERGGSEIYWEVLEDMRPGKRLKEIIRNRRAEKAISEDPRLLTALQDAANSGIEMRGVNALSEVCADIAEEYDIVPEVMNRAINLGRTSLGQN
jgi:hypothetical protein